MKELGTLGSQILRALMVRANTARRRLETSALDNRAFPGTHLGVVSFS